MGRRRHISKLVYAIGIGMFGGTGVCAERLDYIASWIGNSFSGRDGVWVQNFVDGMAVAADGTV